MKKLMILSLAALATLALPVLGAQAKPSDAGGQKAAGKHGAKSKRCAKVRSVGFVVRGTLSAYDESSVTLAVTRSNRHATRWLEDNDPAVFDTTGLTVSFAGVTDADASGVVDLADVLPTDRVRVKGKLALPKARCTGDVVLTVKKVSVSREVEEVSSEE
jgi:hypothetical protein